MDTSANLTLRGFSAAVIAVGLLAAGPVRSSQQAVNAPAVSYACNQPMPAAGPGRVALAGVVYGAYRAGQNPNFFISPSAEEVAADMPTLAAMTNYIRIESSTGPAADILQAAEAAHLCVSLGIWLGPDAKANAAEISAGIRLARSSPVVRSVIVGSEVLLRGNLSVAQLLRDIREVRSALGETVPISYADDYHQWLAHPALAQAVDFVTIHIYPFFQNVPIGSAVSTLASDYRLVAKRFPNKPVVIGETGWPSAANMSFSGAAVPSPQNQARYFHEFVTWATQNHVPYWYFEALDEGWKTNEPGGVGTHWGLYDQGGHLKPALARWLPAASPVTTGERSYRDVFVGTRLETPFNLGIDTSAHRRHWLTASPGVLTMNYPSGQQFGSMFVTVGKPVPPGNRPSIDLSGYRSFSVSLRAGANGQHVWLGIKDRSQPDNGGELTIEETLSTEWTTVALPLSLFANVDLRHLYVVFEVVFQGTAPETVQLRDLRYSPATAPAPVLGPVTMPFAVFTDGYDPGNHYVASGYMGDTGAITMNQTWASDPHDGQTCIQVKYSGAVPGGVGWAGVYWQSPPNNWGTVPGPTGYNLSRASRLTFWVRGATTGHERIQFLVGGITGRYGDSLQPAVKTRALTLSTTWQQVTIDLNGTDLTHIIGGFGWVAGSQQDHQGATFYLDDIIYRA